MCHVTALGCSGVCAQGVSRFFSSSSSLTFNLLKAITYQLCNLLRTDHPLPKHRSPSTGTGIVTGLFRGGAPSLAPGANISPDEPPSSHQRSRYRTVPWGGSDHHSHRGVTASHKSGQHETSLAGQASLELVAASEPRRNLFQRFRDYCPKAKAGSIPPNPRTIEHLLTSGCTTS